MGEIKVYTTSITARPEVRKRVQRVLFVLQSKNIEHRTVDITQSDKDEIDFLKSNCKTENSAVPLLPQIFHDNEYCGGYEEFDNAVENEELFSFLKLQDQASKKDDGEIAAQETNGHVEEEPVTDEDPDAAWERRAKAKRLQKLREEELEQEKNAADENANPIVEDEEPAVEEDPDAAWERRLKAKRQKKMEEDEAKAAEEEQQQEEAPVEEEPVDDDDAWQRRMKRKQQQEAAEDEEPVEETKAEEEGASASVDEVPEDDDAAWERRRKAKKAAEQQEEENDGAAVQEVVAEKNEEDVEEPVEDEEEIIEDDDDVEDEEPGGDAAPIGLGLVENPTISRKLAFSEEGREEVGRFSVDASVF